MKWEKLKVVHGNFFEGLTINTDYVDGNLQNIVITDKDGKMLRLTMGESYSSTIKAYVIAKPKLEKRFRVTSDIEGAPVTLDYEDKHEANQAVEKVGGTIEEVEVEVKEDGSSGADWPF